MGVVKRSLVVSRSAQLHGFPRSDGKAPKIPVNSGAREKCPWKLSSGF